MAVIFDGFAWCGFAGPGFQIVTGTFQHEATQTLDISVEDEIKPIGTTPNHPIWSVDRDAFVRADSLTVGERLQTLDGIARITNISPRGPPEPVYNLEVQVKHTYFVADSGVLVHNGAPCNKLYRYVGEGEAEAIRKTGRIPNVGRTGDQKEIYVTSRYYKTAGKAKTQLQLPSKPKYRIEIDPKNVTGMSRLRRVGRGDNPQWGIGGGNEVITADSILVDPKSLVKLIGAN